jgi:hypothetical protein
VAQGPAFGVGPTSACPTRIDALLEDAAEIRRPAEASFNPTMRCALRRRSKLTPSASAASGRVARQRANWPGERGINRARGLFIDGLTSEATRRRRLLPRLVSALIAIPSCRYRIARSIVIDAPPEVFFATSTISQLADRPSQKLDLGEGKNMRTLQAMARPIHGPATSRASVRWSVGAARRARRHQLEFKKPFKAKNDVQFNQPGETARKSPGRVRPP